MIPGFTEPSIQCVLFRQVKYDQWTILFCPKTLQQKS